MTSLSRKQESVIEGVAGHDQFEDVGTKIWEEALSLYSGSAFDLINSNVAELDPNSQINASRPNADKAFASVIQQNLPNSNK